MNAIDSLLAGLIDYAGLYPPAKYSMSDALQDYLCYSKGNRSAALGRFVVDFDRLSELRESAGDALQGLRLSVVASREIDWQKLVQLLNEGFLIDAVEIKIDQPSDLQSISKRKPDCFTTYIEAPFNVCTPDVLRNISDTCSRAKMRMGGTVAEAFPSSDAVAEMLRAFADNRIAFKATAGLHHPIRSFHRFSYEPDSSAGVMHGFINLFLAASLIHCGGDVRDATLLLDEQDPSALNVGTECIDWHSYSWNASQLREVREEFAISFGSCSFEEPIHDLEALGWI